jgi:hypothetical protein
MPIPFDEAVKQAQVTQAPVARGIAFRVAVAANDGPPTRLGVVLSGWHVEAFEGATGWYRAEPPSALTLADCWARVQQLQSLPDVEVAEPLLVHATEQLEDVAQNPFATAYDSEALGLWGSWQGRVPEAKVQKTASESDWHLAQLKVQDAWQIWRNAHLGKEPGEGIIVGHPDTGYTDHPEVKDRLRLPGFSFLESEKGVLDPGRDDLLKDTSGLITNPIQNPGHGTGTASVIASSGTDLVAGKQIYGVAPGAKVLPLRVSRSVVHFDLEHIGKAVLKAIDQGVHVISMSLGGPWYSQFARDCIRRAQAEGIIVIAAAGNMAPTTVFPAAFPEVIAIAATHAGKSPWRYSGLGRLVDFAAPGEDVWRARADLNDGGSIPSFTSEQGTGTSFATACVAGLAAMWLSYHGGRDAIAAKLGGDRSLVPFAFQYLLGKTADKEPDWVKKKLWGTGIPDAKALLEAKLPPDDGTEHFVEEVERFKKVILGQDAGRLATIGGLFRGIFGVTGAPAVQLTVEAVVDIKGKVRTDAIENTSAVQEAERIKATEDAFLSTLLDTSTGEPDAPLANEVRLCFGVRPELSIWLRHWYPGMSLLWLYERFFEMPTDTLSPALRQRLEAARKAEQERLVTLHHGTLAPSSPSMLITAAATSGSAGPSLSQAPGRGYAQPPERRLRAYAFDPSLETSLETVQINQISIPTRWEDPLAPGPVGEYLEVVDVDPASGCAYQPVDLNHPYLLAQDGLAPSEGDPRFHQQMVYAVAMNTIHRFELALGRPVFWASLRPWFRGRPAEQGRFTPESLQDYEGGLSDRYVQRLRIYPHALREDNAYYSPDKRALLFGYYPGTDDDSGRHFPGGTVFTCLSHDIIAHEMTHALLDGMHAYFSEPTNEDVLAFHEAFADIIALFQHFTFPEVIRQQIAHTRGDLRMNNLLGQLAQQFGQTTGKRGALRNYIVQEQEPGKWERVRPNPKLLRERFEVHDRGGILVAAVFEAFLNLYENRIADLIRIASNGTGRLAEGEIHPDLVNRLAIEAAATANEVLSVCIRALDYVPPVDITFGDFLRALITADYDFGRKDRRQVRIAFIDGFRSWGIYPRDVTTLSEESLRWRGPEDGHFSNLARTGQFQDNFRYILETELSPALANWEPGKSRSVIFNLIHRGQETFHHMLQTMQRFAPDGRPLIPGLDLRGDRFSVTNLRPARRVGMQGEYRTEMVVEVVQSFQPRGNAQRTKHIFRGGATLIVDMRTWDIRYIIYKRLYADLPLMPGRGGVAANRIRFQQAFERREHDVLTSAALAVWQGEDAGELAQLARAYSRVDGRPGLPSEPFALLHRAIGAE